MFSPLSELGSSESSWCADVCSDQPMDNCQTETQTPTSDGDGGQPVWGPWSSGQGISWCFVL